MEVLFMFWLSVIILQGVLQLWFSFRGLCECQNDAWMKCLKMVYHGGLFAPVFTLKGPVRLHGGGGPQVGEGTRLGGVTRLSIQNLSFWFYHVSKLGGGNPPHVTSSTWGHPFSGKQVLTHIVHSCRKASTWKICQSFYRLTRNFAKMTSPSWNTLDIIITFIICSSNQIKWNQSNQ